MASVLFFTSPDFKQNGSRIVISGELHGAVTEKVERIINAGSEVRIIYFIAIYRMENNGSILLKKRIVNSIRFDSLEGIYILNLDGIFYRTGTRRDAYKRIGLYRAVFQYQTTSNVSFKDCYIDASIEYVSALKPDIPATALWEYYMPYIKVGGEISF